MPDDHSIFFSRIADCITVLLYMINFIHQAVDKYNETNIQCGHFSKKRTLMHVELRSTKWLLLVLSTTRSA